jgi:GMP synthase (glutamine-hydrolysing)
MKKNGIIVINFGSQYVQLIARRVRELNVYSEILHWDTPIEEILKREPKGIIFSGGPASVYAEDAPLPNKEIYELGIPILGICYGLQVMAHQLGGEVAPAEKHEYGRAILKILNHDKLFKGCLLYTSPSPRDRTRSRMPSSA